jgi:transposase
MLIHLRQPQDLAELQHLMRRESNAKQRDRYRVVLLALQGEEAQVIAHRTGRSRRFVQRWVYVYRDQGLTAIAEKPRPGRPTHLPRDQEALFKQRLDAGPRPEDGVCTLRGQQVRRILEQEFGVRYSLDGAYDLLHRLGYRYLKPRPRHRKNDPLAMEQFREDTPLLSKPCNRPIPTSASKCGSRMKPALDNKAP